MVASTLALLSLLIPPLAIFSTAAIALRTLRIGAGDGLMVLFLSTIATAILGLFLIGDVLSAIAYGLMLWLPIWLIAVVLRISQKLSLAIEFTVLLGVVGVVSFYGLVSDPADFWNARLSTLMEPMLATAPADVPVEEIKQSIANFSRFVTGVVAAGSTFGSLLALLLARWWQSQLYNLGGFRQEFLALKTSSKFAFGTIITVIVALVTDGVFSQMVWNMVVPLFVLYTFIGIAVFHAMLAERSNAHTWLTGFYVIMFMLSIFVTPLVLLPVAFAGFFDTWVDIRNKIS